MEKNCLFIHQNFWLKLIILLTGLITAIVVPLRVLPILALFAFIYLLLSYELIYKVLKGFRTLLPFLAAYAVTAVIFNVAFLTMIAFLLRLLILVMFVVYFAGCTSLDCFLQDAYNPARNGFNKTMVYFTLATSLYLKRFSSFYQKSVADYHIKHKGLTGLIPILILSMQENWQNKDEIAYEADRLMAEPRKKPEFMNKSNVLGMVFLTILIMLLSV